MSVKLELYDDFVTAMSGVSGVNTSGLWNSQADHENEEIPFAYPAAFLEFTTIAWGDTKLKPIKTASTGATSKQQQSSPDRTLITIHILFEKLKTATQSFSEIDVVIQQVYLALQGITGTHYSPLLRVEERQDVDHDRVIDWQMDFSVNLAECGEADSSLVDANNPIVTLTAIEITKDLEIDNTTIRTGAI